jgi:hypothetical protein
MDTSYNQVAGQIVERQVVAAIRRRIWTAQSFYAFGALLCVFHPYWSIGFIVLMQLYYAIAPRYERHQRSEEG